MASHFLLAVVVDGVLMSGQVGAAAEDCIARFASIRIHLLALVGTRGVVAASHHRNVLVLSNPLRTRVVPALWYLYCPLSSGRIDLVPSLRSMVCLEHLTLQCWLGFVAVLSVAIDEIQLW